MIGIYNRGSKRIKRTFIENIVGYPEWGLKVCENLSDLHKHNIAIVHASEKNWQQLITEYSSSGNVRVRVTVDGNPFNEHPAYQNGVNTFYLSMRAGTLKVEDWKKVLSGLSKPEDVKALVRGENPNGLRRFFIPEVGKKYLPAFTILCEGYLGVHAESKDYHAEINSALELMKWTEFQKSDKYKELTLQSLGEKIDDVRQPKWWLGVFEQESFYENVKKEWKDTTDEDEIPPALNDLLEVISRGNTIVPPKNVADAYQVLVKKNVVTTLSDWQIRRKKFNHDWLKNRFLNGFNGFIEQLEKSNPDCVRLSDFLSEVFPAWESQRQEVQCIVQSFEKNMSPQQLLNSAPLNRCNDETREWLGHLLHGLWLSRYAVRKKSKESQDALIEVNTMYKILSSELEQSMPIGLTKLISLRPQFCKLKDKYKVLYKTLSDLPGYTSHG